MQPFYLWENNGGYCGEVSMMQVGLANGQWMSQFNARRICGTPWMTNLVLHATASGLTPRRGYNLREYAFAKVRGEGMSAALKLHRTGRAM